jgi:hypothetical protein
MVGRIRGAGAAIVAVAACFLLIGCSASAPAPSPSDARAPSDPAASPAAAASASPAPEPQLVPAGTARENLVYFNHVNKAFFAAQPSIDGRAIIDNLVAAGFDKSAMQVTPDKTVNGHPADSVQFSVLLDKECLVGQFGGGEYGSVVAPMLGTGVCLIGKTRPINW